MSVVKPKTNQLLDNIRLLSRGQTIEKPKPKLVTFSVQLKTTLSLVYQSLFASRKWIVSAGKYLSIFFVPNGGYSLFLIKIL